MNFEGALLSQVGRMERNGEKGRVDKRARKCAGARAKKSARELCSFDLVLNCGFDSPDDSAIRSRPVNCICCRNK